MHAALLYVTWCVFCLWQQMEKKIKKIKLPLKSLVMRNWCWCSSHSSSSNTNSCSPSKFLRSEEPDGRRNGSCARVLRQVRKEVHSSNPGTDQPPSKHTQIHISNPWWNLRLHPCTVECLVLFHCTPPPHILVVHMHTHLGSLSCLCSAKQSWMQSYDRGW